MQLKSNQEKFARTSSVVAYNPILPSIHLTTKCQLSILLASYGLWRAFEHLPLIAFRRLRNLSDVLVRVSRTTTPQESPGNRLFGVPISKTCPILRITNEFSSHTTGKAFKVSFRVSCESSNMTFSFTCKRCILQYLRQTGQLLHMRMNGHRYDFTLWKTAESST